MTTNLTKSRPCKGKESKCLIAPTHEKESDAHYPALEVKDINDAFRVLYLIFLAEKSGRIEDLQAFCIEGLKLLSYDLRSDEVKRKMQSWVKDEESMRGFMRSMRDFVVPIVFGMRRN